MSINSTTNLITAKDTNSPNHPLFLHQHDHPSLILISKKLTGSKNYSTWRRSMTIALNAKNKLQIVTGDYTEPSADSGNKYQIGNSLSFVNSATALWKELQENYSQLDGHRIYQLTNDIAQLKQTDCTVEIYYQKLKGIWDELDALESPYACTCQCNCENGRTNGERD
ncbi:uncharacterized protein [Rutidosis leptorrhynchoides]|uniref:uncharacterized protein n=1 Tax=Rutidosis leptorrhynchoides TaxID=125765 RepID=UPI003A994ABC